MVRKTAKSNPARDQSELVDFLSGKFDEVHREQDELKSMFRQLQSSVDGYADEVKTYSQETTMVTSQIRRHDKWIHKIADKVDVKLES